jgi:hypothetical protein
MPHFDVDSSPVLELRQYTLHPGMRNGFVRRFEREFVETQAAAGIEVVGTFLDLDDPDRFVWIRAFPSYEARGIALPAFYDGPVWAALRDETNADLIDSDDVLLLRPAAGLPALPTRTSDELSVHVWPVTSDDEEVVLLDALSNLGTAVGILRSHPGPNNFPRQPIRDDRVVVVISADTLGSLPDGALQQVRLAPTTRSVLR